MSKIKIRGARQHNLKNVDLDIPHNELVVITGLSGSGKSTLAFDTLYAEGQRRYVESLSTYARQFLERMEKPDVDLIEGLSPAIAIEQKTAGHNPRSTVGTVTEIYDYLRLLYARIGLPHCHLCGRLICSQSIDEMVESIITLPENLRFVILSPLVVNQKGSHAEIVKRLRRDGFARVRVDGVILEIEQIPPLSKDGLHTIEAVVDRLVLKDGISNRLADSLELALALSGGTVEVAFVAGKSESVPAPMVFSEKPTCHYCGTVAAELSPASFSFNSPSGACPECDGLGTKSILDLEFAKTSSAQSRNDTKQYMAFHPCPACNGTRLKPEIRAVTIQGKPIYQVAALSIDKALAFFKALKAEGQRALIAQKIVKEIIGRLEFLTDVGLSYLTLDRAAHTLSGGEAQRIRLATQIGAKLTGVVYVLDEPSIGLHQRDNRRLLQTLFRLRDLGNTVLVVEHDQETIEAADFVVDMGPGAGIGGGQVVFAGPSEELISAQNSLTGQFLSGQRRIETPVSRRHKTRKAITVSGACHNNLKHIDVSFPLGCFVCVTGVSGSGKSSLVIETLYRALSQHLYRSRIAAGAHDSIQGVESIDKVINIDQSPIGRTPRSNPCTYTSIFNHIRELFARTPDARVRGYKPGRFSFNVKGGRCEACSGDGIVKIEMQFLPDVYVPCDVCQAKRYNRETLEVRYKGKNIAEVLDMTVNQAFAFFKNIAVIREKLQTLIDVGLGYIHLGQSANTLSGGEAQRVKLARELSKRSTGRTMYILDEPTTGLHMEDIRRLLDILARLVDDGNTAVVIEHNLDVIKTADHVIDLGPEGGDGGGYVLGNGTPEELSLLDNSHTGRFLKAMLMI